MLRAHLLPALAGFDHLAPATLRRRCVMALARLSGRFGQPLGRAGRRRRARSGSQSEQPPDPLSPAERRARRRRYWSVGIGVFLLSVIFGVVIFGYYWEFFRPPRVWAGSVNNVEFTMGDLVQRIRVLQGVNRYQGGRVDLSIVPFENLQKLVNVEILRQAAPGLGIKPSEEAIDRELRRQFQPTPPEGQEVDSGQLDREFRNNYQTFLTATGLSDSDYRVIVEEDLTEFGLFLLQGQNVENTQEHVEVQWIRLPIDPQESQGSELVPDQVSRRLEVEPFDVVAREVSRSAGFADSSGYVGWVPRGAFPNLDPLLYGDDELGVVALAPGETSSPFYARDGIFIVHKLSGPEERDVEEHMKIKAAQELVEQWKNDALQEGTSGGTVKMNFNSSLYEWVADQVSVTAPRIPNTNPTGR